MIVTCVVSEFISEVWWAICVSVDVLLTEIYGCLFVFLGLVGFLGVFELFVLGLADRRVGLCAVCWIGILRVVLQIFVFVIMRVLGCCLILYSSLCFV